MDDKKGRKSVSINNHLNHEEIKIFIFFFKASKLPPKNKYSLYDSHKLDFTTLFFFTH